MFTIIIPFYKGAKHLMRLLLSLPKGIENIIVVDDSHDEVNWLEEFEGIMNLLGDKTNVYWTCTKERKYFSGAVNQGIETAIGIGLSGDFLVLNQDIEFTDSDEFWKFIEENKTKYDSFGERAGEHPLFPNGYVHGVFWYIKKEAWDKIGELDAENFPLWGSTAFWCLKAARKGLKVQAFKNLDFFKHKRENKLDIGGAKITIGDAIKKVLLDKDLEDRKIFANVPLVSVVVTCKNYGKYLPDLMSSLIGGKSSLGELKGQSFQNFEIVIVNDGSNDNSREIIENYVKMGIGVRAFHNGTSVGTAEAYNIGIKNSLGQYISILDADDMMQESRLEKMLEKSKENPHSVIFDDFTVFAFGKLLRSFAMQVSKEVDYDFESLLDKNTMHAGIFFPRQAWVDCGGYPRNFSDGRQDWAVNVAMGRVGWCGVRLAEPLYLYRREQQGRTMKNTTETHQRQFAQKIRSTFPDLFNGREFPMGCCGGRGSRTRQLRADQAKAGLSRSQKRLIGSGSGLVKMRYNGLNNGESSISGQYGRYTFSKTKNEFYVDARDVDFLLGKIERGTNLFSKVIPDEEKKVSVHDATAF